MPVYTRAAAAARDARLAVPGYIFFEEHAGALESEVVNRRAEILVLQHE